MSLVTVFSAVVWSILSLPLQTGGTSVAVVKVPELSEKYQKTTDLEVQFEVVRKKFNADRDEQKARIDKAAKSLQEELKPGTDEFRARKREIARMEADLQAFAETEGERIEQGLARSLRSIFDDIQAAIAEVAGEKGIDVVIAYDEMPNELPNTTQSIRQQIVLQKVLYWNPRVDLTAAVLERLNAKYKAVAPPTGAVNTAPPAGNPPPNPDSKPVKPK